MSRPAGDICARMRSTSCLAASACSLTLSGATANRSSQSSSGVGEFREGRLAIALVGAEKIVARPHRQAHQPMLKRCFAAEAAEFLKGLDPHFLGDVLDLAFQAGVAPDGGKDAGRILLHQRLEARGGRR